MAASEVLRIRIDPELKERVTRMYEQRGTTVSQAVRSFLIDELTAAEDAVAMFDSIMASADEKIAASGMGNPTLEEINEYIERVRSERSEQALAS